LTLKLTIFARRLLNDPEQIRSSAHHGSQSQTPQLSKVVIRVTLAEELLNQLANAEKRMAELEALAHGVKQFSEFQICHYGATEDYAKGYIDCQNNYNKCCLPPAALKESEHG
jgi:hypothetical protein